MKVSIRDADDSGYLLEPINVEQFRRDRSRVRIEPGHVYRLRLYLEPSDPIEMWKPIERDDIAVLEFITHEVANEPEVDDGLRLLIHVRFEAFHDGALRKVLRWGFRSVEGEAGGSDASAAYRTQRVPLQLMPTDRRVQSVSASIAAGVFFAGLADFGISSFAGRDAEADPWVWLAAVFGTGAAVYGLSLLFFWIINRFGFFVPRA